MLGRALSQLARTTAVRSVAPVRVQRAAVSTPLRHYSTALNIHRDSSYNNPNTPFDFTSENYAKIDKLLKKYPPNYKQSAVIACLDIAQIQNGGWVSLAAMNKIAQVLDMPPMRVYEVATFYSMFNREPVGKFLVQVCVTTPCQIRGCDDLIKAIEKHLHIEMGGTTADGWFTLGEMECMGACVHAPMIVVSDYRDPSNFSYVYYEDLDIPTTLKVLDDLKAGRPVKGGSQKGRIGAEPFGGKTSLFGEPRGPHCRDLGKAKADWEAAQAAAAAAAAAKK
eukprot:tig00000042_g15402.t1